MAKKKRKLRRGMGIGIAHLPPIRPLGVPLEERRKNRVAALANQLPTQRGIELLIGTRPKEEHDWLKSFRTNRWPEKDRQRAAFLNAVLVAVIEGRRPSNIMMPDGEYFRWPTTQAPPSGPQSGSIQTPLQQEGVLRALGYSVGANGIRLSERRQILDEIVEKEIRLNLDTAYLSSWGRPRTANRLRKLANTIAALTRNMKRRTPVAPSIEDWELDLEYLKHTYYDGRFDFVWPSVQVS